MRRAKALVQGAVHGQESPAPETYLIAEPLQRPALLRRIMNKIP